MARPVFLVMEMKPRTVWDCHSVAAISSLTLAPSARRGQFQHDGLLAALARLGCLGCGGGLLGRPGFLRCDGRRLGRGCGCGFGGGARQFFS